MAEWWFGERRRGRWSVFGDENKCSPFVAASIARSKADSISLDGRSGSKVGPATHPRLSMCVRLLVETPDWPDDQVLIQRSFQQF